MCRRRAWPLRLRNKVANVQLVWSGNASQRATTASFDHEEGCKTTRKRVWCRVSLCVCSLSYVRIMVFLNPSGKLQQMWTHCAIEVNSLFRTRDVAYNSVSLIFEYEKIVTGETRRLGWKMRHQCISISRSNSSKSPTPSFESSL